MLIQMDGTYQAGSYYVDRALLGQFAIIPAAGKWTIRVFEKYDRSNLHHIHSVADVRAGHYLIGKLERLYQEGAYVVEQSDLLDLLDEYEDLADTLDEPVHLDAPEVSP